MSLLQAGTSMTRKRGCSSGNEVLFRQGNLFQCRQELASLMGEKRKWEDAQRKASLLVSPYKADEWNLMPKFAKLYQKVVTTPMPSDQHEAQLALIRQTVQESIIIEWPKMMSGLLEYNSGDEVSRIEVDMAPLIHRARSVVKCRTSHPTMRVRIGAISHTDDDDPNQPPIIEAFFRATLVKRSGDATERQVAGRLILTQREGTPATKSSDQNGAIVNADGKLIASQAAPDTHTYILLEQFGEVGKTTPFKYERGALCATFPEMGVTLNSMVDRRQLATRYAVQVEVAVNIDNKLIVNHVVLSHPFLIAITNDQTEPLLTSIFWQRLLNYNELPETSYLQPESVTRPEPAVRWQIIREVLRNFVKAQYSRARSLYSDELAHLQCMLFLPRAIKRKANDKELEELELKLFGNVQEENDEGMKKEGSILRRIRRRLRKDKVLDQVLVEKHELMQDKCISISDMHTELSHSVWQWMYRATEMIMDVGHKLCPSPATLEKKCSKTKKQMAAAEEYQTMLSLFNNRTITFAGKREVLKMFKILREDDRVNGTFTKAIMIRFCDENAGHLSFTFANPEEPFKPLMGSLSSDQIKDFKQGLPELLMDEPFPKQYDSIAKTDYDRIINVPILKPALKPSVLKKIHVFPNYATLRMQNDCVQITESETVRINPLTGEKLNALNPSNQHTTLASTTSGINQPLAYMMAMQNLQSLASTSAFPNSVLLNFVLTPSDPGRSDVETDYAPSSSGTLDGKECEERDGKETEENCREKEEKSDCTLNESYQPQKMKGDKNETNVSEDDLDSDSVCDNFSDDMDEPLNLSIKRQRVETDPTFVPSPSCFSLESQEQKIFSC